jgi:hypothetical protein
MSLAEASGIRFLTSLAPLESKLSNGARLRHFSHEFGGALPARMTVFGRAGIAIGFGMSSTHFFSARTLHFAFFKIVVK